MMDPFAPWVVALTHSGFSAARPLLRREGAALLAPGLTLEEVRERVGTRADIDEVQAELERLETKRVWTCTWFHPLYPVSLFRKMGSKAPPVLFGMGRPEIPSSPAIGIVGSRNASPELLDLCRDVAEESLRRGYAVVSGGAKGVDLAALSASGSGGGMAIAFAADAIESVHRKLLRAGCDMERTTVLTPYHPESGFTVGQAMGRNKLIYAASLATLVVCCDEGVGGTWAGAVEALKAGWTPVGVWTGGKAREGNQALLRLGAAGVSEVADVFALVDRSNQQGSLDL